MNNQFEPKSFKIVIDKLTAGCLTGFLCAIIIPKIGKIYSTGFPGTQFAPDMYNILFSLAIIGKILIVIIPILLAVAYLTLLERKVMAGIQRRRGPSVTGIMGLLQPFADGAKLFLKEIIIPVKANKFLFIGSPILFLAMALTLWSLMPLSKNIVISDANLGILFILALSSLAVYGLIFSGWSSNSQYAFLGSLRSAAQMISYEVSLTVVILTAVILTQSLNLTQFCVAQTRVWFILLLFPIFLIFFITALAETSRPPFDLPEAEAELVSGYNLEYASMGFALFFIAEYSSIIFMSFLTTILFMGGWAAPCKWVFFTVFPPVFWLSFKAIIFIFGFIAIRAALPRYRFDQLMFICWKCFLPVVLAIFMLVFFIAQLTLTINYI